MNDSLPQILLGFTAILVSLRLNIQAWAKLSLEPLIL